VHVLCAEVSVGPAKVGAAPAKVYVVAKAVVSRRITHAAPRKGWSRKQRGCKRGLEHGGGRCWDGQRRSGGCRAWRLRWLDRWRGCLAVDDSQHEHGSAQRNRHEETHGRGDARTKTSQFTNGFLCDVLCHADPNERGGLLLACKGRPLLSLVAARSETVSSKQSTKRRPADPATSSSARTHTSSNKMCVQNTKKKILSRPDASCTAK
jgi:hypothetical protein